MWLLCQKLCAKFWKRQFFHILWLVVSDSSLHCNLYKPSSEGIMQGQFFFRPPLIWNHKSSHLLFTPWQTFSPSALHFSCAWLRPRGNLRSILTSQRARSSVQATLCLNAIDRPILFSIKVYFAVGEGSIETRFGGTLFSLRTERTDCKNWRELTTVFLATTLLAELFRMNLMAVAWGGRPEESESCDWKGHKWSRASYLPMYSPSL